MNRHPDDAGCFASVGEGDHTARAQRCSDTTETDRWRRRLRPVDRNFILSEANKHGIFLAFSFEDKVGRFIRLISERVFPRFSERSLNYGVTLEQMEQNQAGLDLLYDLIADREISERVKRLEAERTPLQHFSYAQQHPGLAYDPEVLGKTVRVLSGKKYDSYVRAETQATRMRYRTEKSVQAKRNELLVPLPTTDQIEQPQAVPTQTSISS